MIQYKDIESLKHSNRFSRYINAIKRTQIDAVNTLKITLN
jgi:hypothetical protein